VQSVERVQRKETALRLQAAQVWPVVRAVSSEKMKSQYGRLKYCGELRMFSVDRIKVPCQKLYTSTLGEVDVMAMENLRLARDSRQILNSKVVEGKKRT
jgi:hypothetical protein